MAIVYAPHSQWGKVNTLRQTYHSSGYAGNSFFHSNPKQDSDFLLMGMNDDETNEYIHKFDKSKRILLIMENPSIWSPSSKTFDLAGTIISPFINSLSTTIIQHHSAIPWFYGINFSKKSGLLHQPLEAVLTLDQLISMPLPEKPKLLSVIVSGKNSSPGYQWRLNLAFRLKNILGSACDIFGFGHNPIADKRDALDPYMFHLCIENESSEHYWSEKLADAYLGYCYPIYSGARSVNEYFPSPIDTIEFGIDIETAAKKAIRIISQFDNSKIRQIIENRNSILFQHNLYYLVDRLIHGRNGFSSILS